MTRLLHEPARFCIEHLGMLRKHIRSVDRKWTIDKDRDRRHILLVSDGRTPLGVVTLDDVLHAVVGEPAVSH